MKGFFISVKNDLLEPKHVKNMGEAIWLYMWLLDKMTSVNENGVGKVLNHTAITYDQVFDDLGMSRRTYTRWITKLRSSGYINTIEAQYGQYIVITKAKKLFGKEASSVAKSGAAKTTQPRHKRRSSTTKVAQLDTKSGAAVYIYNNTVDNTVDNTVNGNKVSEFKKQVSKLYYEAIKALDIPIKNHNTLRTKINEMANDKEPDKIINYLTFMRDRFGSVEWDYKPHVNEALDIYSQRAKIRNTFKKHLNEKPKVWRAK